MVRYAVTALLVGVLASSALAEEVGDQRADGPFTVAIMDFSPMAYSPGHAEAFPNLGSEIGRILTSEFSRGGGFDVLARFRLDAVLVRAGISTNERIVNDEAVAIGKELGVDAIVLGTFTPRRLGLDVAARIVSIPDGDVLSSETLSVSRNAAVREESFKALANRLIAAWYSDLGFVMDVYREPDETPLLVVDIGGSEGLQEGAVIEILDEGDPITHPVSQRPLGRPGIPVGYAVIVYTQGQYSYARVLERYADADYQQLQRVLLTENRSAITNNDLSIVNRSVPVMIYSDLARGIVLLDGREVPLADRRATIDMRIGTHIVELLLGGSSIAQKVVVTARRAMPEEVIFRGKDVTGRLEFDLPIELQEAFLDGERYGGTPLRRIDEILVGTRTLVLPDINVEDYDSPTTAVEEILIQPGRATTLSSLSSVRGILATQSRLREAPVREHSERTRRPRVEEPPPTGTESQPEQALLDLEPFLGATARWSPDGFRVLYEAEVDGDWEVFVLHVGSGATTNLSHSPASDDRSPCWSPNGGFVAFETERDGNREVYIVQADGEGATNLSQSAGPDGRPVWSPDGAKIAFESSRGGNFEIYLMNPDGSGLVRLTNSEEDERGPIWSPDGAQLLCWRGEGGRAQIEVLSLIATEPVRTLDNGVAVELPTPLE